MNHLWQSTLFAIAVGLAALVLRKHRARTRYWLWLAASLKFLVPFSCFVAMGSHIEWRTVQSVTLPEWLPTAQQMRHQASVIVQPAATVSLWDAALLVWACGLLVVLGYYGLHWLRIRAVLRQASPVNADLPIKVITSPTLLEPAVFGLFRPVLLIPERLIDSLSPAQWDAVLAHELCHVRYRDNLTAALHMIVQAVFWFHPLVWWLGARLVAERERACDEAVLQTGTEPEVYAEAILQVCRLYLGSPLPCAAGVGGANLKQRVERIMAASVGRKLSFGARVLLVVAAALTVTAPLMLGIMNAPPAHVQVTAERQSTRSITWESVKLSASPKRATGFDRGPGASFGLSDGEVNIKYASLRWLVSRAYMLRHFEVAGGPEWATVPMYEITAKANSASIRQIRLATGTMLQAVLRDRFAMRFHYEIRQLPSYALVVASNGPKLKPTVAGSCTVVHWPLPETLPRATEKNPKPICGIGQRNLNIRLNHVEDVIGMSIAGAPDNPASLANFLTSEVGRPVVDKTGLQGRYDVHLEWNLAATEAQLKNPNASSEDAANPSLFAALQNQLGLKLVPEQGPVKVLVIDHAEKPSL